LPHSRGDAVKKWNGNKWQDFGWKFVIDVERITLLQVKAMSILK
jgi:hypothetical protein